KRLEQQATESGETLPWHILLRTKPGHKQLMRTCSSASRTRPRWITAAPVRLPNLSLTTTRVSWGELNCRTTYDVDQTGSNRRPDAKERAQGDVFEAIRIRPLTSSNPTLSLELTGRGGVRPGVAERWGNVPLVSLWPRYCR